MGLVIAMPKKPKSQDESSHNKNCDNEDEDLGCLPHKTHLFLSSFALSLLVLFSDLRSEMGSGIRIGMVDWQGWFLVVFVKDRKCEVSCGEFCDI